MEWQAYVCSGMLGVGSSVHFGDNADLLLQASEGEWKIIFQERVV